MSCKSIALALVLFAPLVPGTYGQAAITGENLIVSPPKDFKLNFQTTRDKIVTSEWIPTSDTTQGWTQMLTVQIFRGAQVDASTFVQRVATSYATACPGTTSKGIVTGESNGYVVSVIVLNCPMNAASSKPETTAIRVIRGRDAVYSVQRVWRSVPSDQEIGAVMQALAKAVVCDARTADHPCPSLDNVAPLK